MNIPRNPWLAPKQIVARVERQDYLPAVTKPVFYVSLHELEDGPKQLTGLILDDWLRHALADTDVTPVGTNDGRLDVLLTKNGQDVLVQGHLTAHVSVPCARTLDPANYRVRPEVFLMLVPGAKRPSNQGEGRSSRKSTSGRGEQRSAVRNPTKSNGKSTGGWENDPVLSDDDAAEDTYHGDVVVLDDFLREFILLEVPMIPLREDLRGTSFEANPPLPDTGGARSATDVGPSGSANKPLDPRLSALAELKAQLEKKE